MKKWLSTLSITLALFAPVFAQSDPAPATSAKADVTVQAPAPAPAAPNVNVDVSAPSAPANPSSVVETHTSNTTVVDHTASAPAAPTDNTGLMVLGGVVGILALGAIIMAASKSA